MKAPVIILLVLALLGLGYKIAKHGELRKPEKHNFWDSLVIEILLWTLFLWSWGWTLP